MFYKIENPTKGSRQLFELRKKLNAEDCRYYVYIHYKNELPIYVGKGTFKEYCQTDNQQRCFQSQSREYDVKSFVDEIKILGFYSSEDVALKIETTLTDKLKEVSKGKWEIYNKSSGNVVSEESKKKMKENHADFKGEKHPIYGKHLSEETKEKIRKSWTEKTRAEMEEIRKKMRENHADYKGENHPRFGKENKWGRHTEEWKKEMSKRLSGSGNPMYGRTGDRNPMFGRKGKDAPGSIPVCCPEINKCFDSAKEAGNYCRRDPSSICKCCKGKQKTVYGYDWYYLDDIFDLYFGE